MRSHVTYKRWKRNKHFCDLVKLVYISAREATTHFQLGIGFSVCISLWITIIMKASSPSHTLNLNFLRAAKKEENSIRQHSNRIPVVIEQQQQVSQRCNMRIRSKVRGSGAMIVCGAKCGVCATFLTCFRYDAELKNEARLIYEWGDMSQLHFFCFHSQEHRACSIICNSIAFFHAAALQFTLLKVITCQKEMNVRKIVFKLC